MYIFHLFFQNPYNQGGQGDSGRRPVGNFAAALSKLRKGAAGGHDPSGTSSHFDAYSFQQDQQQQPSGTNKRPHDSQGTQSLWANSTTLQATTGLVYRLVFS